MSALLSLFGHDPDTYEPHPLHGSSRRYPETNCYTDVLIELLHARGDDPTVVLGATLRTDFEGDQWTFFKPSTADLDRLLGVDIHEMQVYRSLEDHIVEQLVRGCTTIVELDSWYLPDTAATSYRTEHVKTSVAVEAIDPVGEILRYYHNRSLHELRHEDYRAVLRLDGDIPELVLPPYLEIVRFDDDHPRDGALRDAAIDAMHAHVAAAPAANPFVGFGARLEEDIPQLLEGDVDQYHQYAFATVRMAGAAFELCADYVRRLIGADSAPASEAFDAIADATKLLGFKLARRRSFDPAPVVDDMGEHWARAFENLRSLRVR